MVKLVEPQHSDNPPQGKKRSREDFEALNPSSEAVIRGYKKIKGNDGVMK